MNYPVAACVGATIGFILFLVAANVHNWMQSKRRKYVSKTSDLAQQFCNVYAFMTEQRRQSIVRYYMEKHECDQQSAMRFAMDDKARDANRWAS